MKAVESHQSRSVLAWLGVSFAVAVVGDLYLHYGYFKYDYEHYSTTKEVFLLFFVLKTLMLALQYRSYMKSWYTTTNVVTRTLFVGVLLAVFLVTLMNLYLAANHLMTLSTFPLMIWRTRSLMLPTNTQNSSNTTNTTGGGNSESSESISYDYNATFSHKDIYLSLVEVVFGLIEVVLLLLYVHFAKTYYGLPWTKAYDLLWALLTLVQNVRQLPKGLYLTVKPREDKEQ